MAPPAGQKEDNPEGSQGLSNMGINKWHEQSHEGKL